MLERLVNICGFRGLSGCSIGMCVVLVMASRVFSCNCDYKMKFSLNRVKSLQNACNNRPVACSLSTTKTVIVVAKFSCICRRSMVIILQMDEVVNVVNNSFNNSRV